MSLHAQLSPEAIEKLRAQKRNNSIGSFITGVLVVVLIALITLVSYISWQHCTGDSLCALPWRRFSLGQTLEEGPSSAKERDGGCEATCQ